MIRIYLQYSYGGFKTFFIEGLEKEPVIKEVTNDEDFEFPSDAHCYFQYGGSKIIYRYLDNGKLDLVVREIPSIHKDGDGRNIPCAVQFIGDSSDRHQLDYLATDIANDFEKFHDFFSHLFKVRGNLIIDGDKLRKWLDNHNIPYICDGPVEQLKRISDIGSGVILFVPLSKNFGLDATVTQNVTEDLNLPLSQMRKDNCIITYNSLITYQNKTKITTELLEDNRGDNDVSILDISIIEKKDAEIKKLKEKVNDYFSQLSEKNKEISLLKTNNRELTEELYYNKRILYGICVITLVLALFSVYSLIFK